YRSSRLDSARICTLSLHDALPIYYENNEIVGIDAEIAGAIADKLGLEVEIQDMEFDSIITAVATGKADIGLAGMTVTPARPISRSEEHTSELQSRFDLVCRLRLEK